jgi:hypothetical protein
MTSVILNAYKRTEYLEDQLIAVNNQSVKPSKIYVWQNYGGFVREDLKNNVVFAQCNVNLGVWARFAFALNLDTEYICLFDDDTIPGSRWFENCINTMKTHEGLLGTRGIRFLSPNRYSPFHSFGWDAPNEHVEQVDIVGHAWFFKREWLSSFWRELPSIGSSRIVGEDIHFSYTLQKYLGVSTFVPPHPINDQELWGSIPKTAIEIGNNKFAISKQPDTADHFDVAINYYTKKGFKLYLTIKQRANAGVIIGYKLNHRIRNLFKRSPYIFSIAKRIRIILNKFKIYI